MRRLLPALLLFPSLAIASPWGLPQGTVIIEGRYDYSVADKEFLDEGGAVVYPLNGRYAASTYTLDARIGFTNKLEFELSVPIRQVTYTADPVILFEGPTLDFYQENIINLSRSETGLGDINISGRYNLAKGQFAAALELKLKTPTGYDPPSGTFGDRPDSAEAFFAQAMDQAAGQGPPLVTPGNVQDDVTLGDGQVDLQGSVLLGYALRSGTFFRLDTGWRQRFGDAGDQLVGSFRAGQLLWGRLLLLAGAEFEYTIVDGEIIGVSVAAEDPTIPAEQYGGFGNLLLREVRLERDALTIPVGAIVRASDNVEISGTYSHVLLGRNTAATRTISIGVGVRTDMM